MFGLFKSKKDIEIEARNRRVEEFCFPNGDKDVARDVSRILEICGNRLSSAKLIEFTKGAKAVSGVASINQERAISLLRVNYGNALSDAELNAAYVYLAGEALYNDNWTRFVTSSGPKQTRSQLEKQWADNRVKFSRGTQTDTISGGFGEYGICETNPIPTISSNGSDEYISKLRFNRKPVSVKRRSSIFSSVSDEPVDAYLLTTDGNDIPIIYVSPYHRKNSQTAPKGFSF
jgi:hypothetical protein